MAQVSVSWNPEAEPELAEESKLPDVGVAADIVLVMPPLGNDSRLDWTNDIPLDDTDA